MQTDYIKEFIDLTGTLSFTRSAINLNITQPTLSRHIAELEAKVGAPLFHRTKNSVQLTRAGKAFYERATPLMSNYETMFEEAYAVSHQRTIPVRVSGSTVQPTVNRLFSKLAAQAVIRDLPIRFEYTKTRTFTGKSPSTNAIDLLLDDEADLIIEPLNRDSANFELAEGIHLCDEELLVFASPVNPLASKERLVLEDLREETLVTLAVYRHCPFLMREPFQDAGYDISRQKTIFIGNLLEIPEHLAALGPHEIIALQKGFCESFGFGQDGLGGTAALDMHDPRLRIGFYALYRKDETSTAIASAVSLLEDIVDGCARTHPQLMLPSGVPWSSAFYKVSPA